MSSERVVRVQKAFGADVRGVCFGGGRKNANVSLPSVGNDARAVVSARKFRNADHGQMVVFLRDVPVFGIAFCRYFSQIAWPVVVSDAIYVIHHAIRPAPMFKNKHQMVCKVVRFSHANL